MFLLLFHLYFRVNLATSLVQSKVDVPLLLQSLHEKLGNNNFCHLTEIQGLTTAGVVNATVLTTPGQPINMAPGQPFQIATSVPGSPQLAQRQGPQKFIVANQPGGTVHHVATGAIGQPRLIVPAQQVALLSNGGGVANATQNIEIKKEGN